MYRILVPIDTEENRVRGQVAAIRDLPQAADEVHVDLLYVYEEVDSPPDEAGRAYIDRINENIEDIQGLPETADLARMELHDAGIETEVHEVTGDPADAILEVATEYDVDAIVIGTRRRSPVGKALFGSVAQDVILKSDRPVLVTTA